MADSQDNRPLAYNLSDEETNKLIEDYKAKVMSGEILRPCIPHFIATTGFTEEQVADVIRRGRRENANTYTRRSQALTNLFSWLRGMMFQCPGWGGNMKTAALFLLSQDFGDGVVYQDKTTDKSSSGNKVVLQFGGNDKRASKAAK